HDRRRGPGLSVAHVDYEPQFQEGSQRIQIRSVAMFGQGVMKTTLPVTLVLASLLAAAPAFAQGGVQELQARLQGTVIDLSGTWANRLHEDWIERAPGPAIGDYTGL